MDDRVNSWTFGNRAGAVARKLCIFVFPLAILPAAEPRYDLLLKGGHVVDAKNRVSEVLDVAIAAGKIAAVAKSIPAAEARRTVDASSLYVVPGLVDIHTHLFASGMGREYSGEYCVRPDEFSFRT